MCHKLIFILIFPAFAWHQIYQTSKSGLGVRTTRAFNRGEIIAQYPGDLITTRQEHDQRELKYGNTAPLNSYMFMFRWKEKCYWYVYSKIQWV